MVIITEGGFIPLAVAGLYWLGHYGSIALARLPAMLAGAACPAILFLLLDRTVGRIPALFAGLLLTLDSSSIVSSQFARFYTMQAACVLGMVFFGHDLGHRSIRGAALRGAAAVLCAALAMNLQITSVVAVLTFIAFLFGELLFRPAVRTRLALGKRRWWVVGGLILCLVVGLKIGMVLWPTLRATDGWAQENRSNWRFYFNEMQVRWPVLWPATILFVAAAFIRWRRETLLFVVLFTTTFAVQSLGGMKAIRYILHVTPFLFALWAMGGIVVAENLLKHCLIALTIIRAGRIGRCAAVVLALVCSVACLLANPGLTHTLVRTARSVNLEARDPAIIVQEPEDAPWNGSALALQAIAGRTAVLATADAMRTALYVTVPQISLRSDGDPTRAIFSRDRRTGLPRVGRKNELETLVRCTPEGKIAYPKKDVA